MRENETCASADPRLASTCDAIFNTLAEADAILAEILGEPSPEDEAKIESIGLLGVVQGKLDSILDRARVVNNRVHAIAKRM